VNPPSALRIFVKTVIARAYPRVVGANRERSWVIVGVALPLLGTLAMVLVYRGLQAPQEYLGFVVLGGAMLAFWQSVLFTMATQFSWERESGMLELYTIAPTGFPAILLGMALGAMVTTATRAAAVIAAGSLIFGVTYHLEGLPPALGVFGVTLVALYCLGMLLASLFLFYSREAWHLSNGLQEPVYLLSGLFFPVRALGAYVGGAASLIPLTLGLDAIRQLLLPQTPRFLSPLVETLALVAQTLVYAALAQAALQVMEARARREARFILRGA